MNSYSQCITNDVVRALSLCLSFLESFFRRQRFGDRVNTTFIASIGAMHSSRKYIDTATGLPAVLQMTFEIIK